MESHNTYIIIWPLLWLLSRNFCDAAKSDRNLTLIINPSWVIRGQSVQLHCGYEQLSANPLYSVKWYRGTAEFYRYSPSEHPPAKIFPVNGIKVDLSVSNATQVTVRNVGFILSGNFTCEVTEDAPTFYTASATNVLTVAELPHEQPILFTDHDRYDPGDILNAFCSSSPSKPAATITFLLNDKFVRESHPTEINAKDNLQYASKNLTIQVLPSHYQNGQLVLKCTAEVGALYSDYVEASLWTARRDPIPERVTSPNKANTTKYTNCIEIQLIVATSFSILLHFIYRKFVFS